MSLTVRLTEKFPRAIVFGVFMRRTVPPDAAPRLATWYLSPQLPSMREGRYALLSARYAMLAAAACTVAEARGHTPASRAAQSATRCAADDDCVVNDVCFPTRCVRRGHQARSHQCSDIVPPSVSCSCVRH